MMQGGAVFSIPSGLPPEVRFLYIWGYVKYYDGFEGGSILSRSPKLHVTSSR